MKTTPPTKHRCRVGKSRPRSPFRIVREASEKMIELVPRQLHIRHILVPLDFSESSKKALRYAVSFAQQSDAKITALHVRPVPYYPAELGGFPSVVPADEPPPEKVQERLEAEIRGVAAASLCERTLLRCGPAFDEICQAAREFEIDLIIIATHGRTGLKRALLGSTAERVVRHAPCPVLVVREREREFA